MESIDKALTERCLDIVGDSNFITGLCDGSQARKTRSEKELIMIRVHYRGTLVVMVVTLAEMQTYGGGDAASLVKALKDALDAAMPIPSWRKKLVSVTTDGASVNFGELSGFLTRLAVELPWLIRTELCQSSG